MEAKNLRLGNYVMNGDDIGGVERLSIIRISTSSPHVGVEISPIKLTEEWLLRFGFSRFGEGVVYWENENILIEQDGENNFSLSVGCEYTVGNPFKYVHQLQNLYFALTGKELELKPFVEEK